MAKTLTISGFKVAFRLDRVDAVDRMKNEDGNEIIRIFISGGIEGGYHLNFGVYGDIADRAYEHIIKTLNEEI